MDRFEMFKKFSNGLLSYALDAFFGNTTKDKGFNMVVALAAIIALALFVVLLYAGAESVFLLTRTKIGTKGVNKIRGILSSISFLLLAYICYKFHINYYGEALSIGSEFSFLLASITFLCLGLVLFFRTFTAGNINVIDPIYRGNSWLLGGLVKEGRSQSFVQDVAEPLLFLAIGVYLTSFNYLWGLPFVFCAISCWFHLGVEAIFGFFKDRKDLSNGGLIYAQNRNISKIVN